MAVTLGRLEEWTQRAGDRLAATHGLWHYVCAPVQVRKYTPSAATDEPPRPIKVVGEL